MKNILLVSATFILVLKVFGFEISGTANDQETGTSLAGLELTLYTPSGLVKSATTMPDGTFIFTNLQDGSHELEFHDIFPVIINGTYYLRTVYDDPIVVNGGNVSGIIFEIPPHHPDYTVKGNLYDAITNEPLQDQNISLRLDFQAHIGFFFAWSESDGTYQFEDPIPDWTYTFDVFENNYYYGDQMELTIDTTGPEVITIDFYLQPKDGVYVTGRLYDVETNEPIMMAGRTVRLSAINSLFAETNADGKFYFVNVDPGYYANITITSEDTAYINCPQSTINDITVPPEGLMGIELYQKKFQTVHQVKVYNSSFVPGETKTITFSLVNNDLTYGAIWGVQLILPSELTAMNAGPFNHYYNNSNAFDYIGTCYAANEAVWEGYHSVFGSGNVGNVQALNDSVYADVEFQFASPGFMDNLEIFYEVFYSYACTGGPFSYGTIELVNDSVSTGMEQTNGLIQKTLSVYPNPAKGTAVMRMSLDTGAYGKLVICDMAGREIKVIRRGVFIRGNTEISLDLSGLENGVYVLVYTDDKDILTEKLFVTD